MNESEIGEVMLTATRQTLESMFFTGMEAEVPPGRARDELGLEAWAIEVGFSGRPAGAFWLEVLPETSRALASSFLGAFGEEVHDERVREVALELANMLCGSVLSHFGPDCTFLLAPPCWAKPEGSVVSRYLRTPEGLLGTLLRLDAPIPESGPDGRVPS